MSTQHLCLKKSSHNIGFLILNNLLQLNRIFIEYANKITKNNCLFLGRHVYIMLSMLMLYDRKIQQVLIKSILPKQDGEEYSRKIPLPL